MKLISITAAALTISLGSAAGQAYGQPGRQQGAYGQPSPPQGRSQGPGYGQQPYQGALGQDRNVPWRPTLTTPTYPLPPGQRDPQAEARAVNPAPGARRPYLGAGERRFYNVGRRISALESRMAGLPHAQRRQAMSELRRIRALEARQRGKHGGRLRDWDRERLTVMLNKLVRRYPSLRT